MEFLSNVFTTPYLFISISDKTEGTLFIFADAVFRLDGKVLGWEMHVERKGKIELAVNLLNVYSMIISNILGQISNVFLIKLGV